MAEPKGLLTKSSHLRNAMQVLPFWVRLMQCCRAYFDTREQRHLANALKYCSSILVILLSLTMARGGAWAVGWAVASVVSSVYAYLWDLVMDWGLRPWAVPGCWPHRANRQFIYPAWAYYAAGTTNGLARLTWALYISPGQQVTLILTLTITLFITPTITITPTPTLPLPLPLPETEAEPEPDSEPEPEPEP